jgi:hypothetical protein
MGGDVRAEIALHSLILAEDFMCCKGDSITITILKIRPYPNNYAIFARASPPVITKPDLHR